MLWETGGCLWKMPPLHTMSFHWGSHHPHTLLYTVSGVGFTTGVDVQWLAVKCNLSLLVRKGSGAMGQQKVKFSVIFPFPTVFDGLLLPMPALLLGSIFTASGQCLKTTLPCSLSLPAPISSLFWPLYLQLCWHTGNAWTMSVFVCFSSVAPVPEVHLSVGVFRHYTGRAVVVCILRIGL